MPLVKPVARQPQEPPPPELSRQHLASADADERRRAARALAGDPDAASALAERLAIETEPSVRDSLFAGLVSIGGPHAAELVAPFVRSGDAALRGGAIDVLKTLAEDAMPALDRLLSDPEPDTRLLAIEVTRSWPSDIAVPRLLTIIESDPHVNVCAAAVDVATEVGTEALLDPLAGLRARFAGEEFLAFAIDVASRRIRASRPEAV